MFRKFMFALLISVFLLGSTAFAQDEKEEKKLDFEDIQSTPEKVLEHFFAFFKEADIENLKKICDSGLHEELEQFAEMKEMMKGVRFEFKPLEFITKDDFCLAVAEVCIIDENRGKFEVDIAAISLRKTDDKWLILKLDDTVEDAPEWAQEAYKSIMKEKKFFTKFREAQASPYFVAYEYIGALAEKDLETLKILTPSDDKSQEMVVKFAEIVEEGMKFKTLVKNVVEKEDYAVCMLEISVVGEETEDFVFLMKNEGYKELPSWKIIIGRKDTVMK